MVEAKRPLYMSDRAPIKQARQLSRPFLQAALRGCLSMGFNKIQTFDSYVFTIPPYVTLGSYLALRSGEYEINEIGLLRDVFEPSNDIIEIGSNIGVVASIAFRERLKPEGRMLCIEPHAKALPYLQRNISREMWQAENKGKSCAILNSAIASPKKSGTGAFLSRSNLSSGLSEFVQMTDKDHVVEVPVTSLSGVLSSRRPAGKYSLICDIEGGEIPLIFEDAAALDQCDQMLIELHQPSLTGRRETPEDMLAELGNLGFHQKAQAGNCYVLAR